MEMTEAQKKTIGELQGEQVAWPPMFEVDAGAVVVVLVDSFEMTTRSWASYTPDNLWLRSVRVEADGSHTKVGEATLQIRG